MCYHWYQLSHRWTPCHLSVLGIPALQRTNLVVSSVLLATHFLSLFVLVRLLPSFVCVSTTYYINYSMNSKYPNNLPIWVNIRFPFHGIWTWPFEGILWYTSYCQLSNKRTICVLCFNKFSKQILANVPSDVWLPELYTDP